MKALLVVCLLALGLLFVVLVIIGTSLNGIVKTGVQTLGPEIMGVPVTLDEADLSLLSGEGQLTGLLVKNPQGFHTARALYLEDIRIRLDQKSLLTDTVIIEEVVIDGPEITYEGTLSGSNLSKIQENVEAYAASGSGGNVPDATSERAGTQEKKVQINHFILKNVQIKLSATVLQGQALTIPLPNLHLRDIGKASGGATLQQVSSQIFEAIYAAITEAVSDSDQLVERRMEQVEESVKELKGVAEKAASEVLKGLEGIFNK